MKKLWFTMLATATMLVALVIGANAVSAATSGTTGDCTWTLDGTHLTISGNGAMASREEYYWAAPWGKSITSVTIKDGVMSIGDYAFASCKALTSVTIPDSVTSIGEFVFFDCDSLTSITIPDSVTSIGNGAFRSCDGLVLIEIPSNVTRIRDSAFADCTNLQTVNFNAINCTDAGGYRALVFDKEHPNGHIKILGTAFCGCSNLRTVNIGKRVQTIPKYIFAWCTGLTSITIPDSVTSIGDSAFEYCDNLTIRAYEGSYAATYANDNNIPFVAEKVPECLVYKIVDGEVTITDCDESARDELVIPSKIEGYPVTTIGSDAFSYCYYLTSIAIPNSVTSIGNRAFCNCKKLTSVTIPDGVTSVGDGAFSYCTNLISVALPDSVITIGNDVFYSCWNLSPVIMGDSITTIGDRAFYGCSRLKSITIPDSVISIGDDTFYGCTSLTIYGYTDSYAEIYAEENRIPFAQKYIVTIPEVVGGTGVAHKDEALYGETVMLVATPNKGYEFARWMIGNRTYAKQALAWTVNDDITATPVFRLIDNDEYTVIFRSADGRVIATLTSTEIEAGAELPAVPARYGYTNGEWDFVPEDGITSNMSVYPTYTKENIRYTIKAIGGKASTKSAEYETCVTLTAQIDGFTAWVDENGNVLSTNRVYIFFATRDITVTAVSDKTVDYAVNINPTSLNTDNGDTYTITLVGETMFADGYKLIECGFVYTTKDLDEATLKLGNAGVKKAVSSKLTEGQFAFNLKSAPKTATITARAYMVIEKDGVQTTVYSGLCDASWK